jgi:hypothetical protein
MDGKQKSEKKDEKKKQIETGNQQKEGLAQGLYRAS